MNNCLLSKNQMKTIDSNGEIHKKSKDNESIPHKENNVKDIHAKILRNSEHDVEIWIRRYMSGEKIPEYFYKLSRDEQKQWLHEKLKMTIKILPDTLINLTVGFTFEGDCGNPIHEKPNWLDMEKFRKGQEFAMDNFFGLYYAMLLSMFIPFSFEDGFKPIIITGKSSTPFMAFKRYLSTTLRVRNWYMGDPWIKGTAAYNDIQAVRKMHLNIRKKLSVMTNKDIDSATTMTNPYCPTREILLKDFQSSCPVPLVGQCPYMLFQNSEFMNLRPKPLNQTDMAVTQILFLGLIVLYPKAFGICNADNERLEAFCHTWRGLGYLLGIDDDFNICRGPLEEVQQRCKDIIELWMKPNLREMTPEYEHVMRCVIDGFQVKYAILTYESAVLYLSELINIHTPRLYSFLSYKMWIMHNFVKLFFSCLSRVPVLMKFLSKLVNKKLDKATTYTAENYERIRSKQEKNFRNIREDSNPL